MSCLLFVSFPIIIDKILHFLLPVKDSKSVCLRDMEYNAMTRSPRVGERINFTLVTWPASNVWHLMMMPTWGSFEGAIKLVWSGQIRTGSCCCRSFPWQMAALLSRWTRPVPGHWNQVWGPTTVVTSLKYSHKWQARSSQNSWNECLGF